MIHLMIRNCLKKLQLLLNSFKEKEGKNNKKNKRKNKQQEKYNKQQHQKMHKIKETTKFKMSLKHNY